MLATNDAGTTPPAGDPGAGEVGDSTTTIGGAAGPGFASSTARVSAATPANAETPRQNAS